MKHRTEVLLIVFYVLASFIFSFFITSEFVSLIGIPVNLNRTVVMQNDQTFDHQFFVTDIRGQSGTFYSVHDAEPYPLAPNGTFQLAPSSNFRGTIHVDKFYKDGVELNFHLHRDRTISIVIGIIAVFLTAYLYPSSKYVIDFVQKKLRSGWS